MHNTDTETQSMSAAERPSGPHRDHRRPERGEQRRVNRNAAEVMQHLPPGWSARVVEPDFEGTKGSRIRLRVMVFENPDKGFKLLPFMTVRHSRRMTTDSSTVETVDDMDILPANVLEAALPAILFEHGKVLENITEIFAEYAKKQAALPPPSKRPLTQRPFAEGLAKIARAQARAAQQPQPVQPQQAQPQRHEQQSQHKKRDRKGRGRPDRSAVLMMSLM